MRHLSPHAGLSLVEMTVVLGVLTLITGAVAPAGMDLMARAKDLQASRDALSIRDAVVRLLTDSGAARIGTRGTDGQPVEMLVGSGAAPSAVDAAALPWTRPVNPNGLVDLLDHHLVTNEPAGDPANGWRLPGRVGDFGWRGAYLSQAVGADPWGRRYAVNVGFLLSRNEVVVISAGPNGVVETPYEGQGLVGTGDDRVVLVK